MAHFLNVCEHGHIHGQCRCPSKDKTINHVECPFKNKVSYKGKHAKEVRPMGQGE